MDTTQYYSLNLFDETDKPDLLAVYNSAMIKIDRDMNGL